MSSISVGSSISDGWLCPILDRAAALLLAWEQNGLHPSELRVHPEVYERLAGLRAREMRAGVPLLVLGTDVVADADLTRDGFALSP